MINMSLSPSESLVEQFKALAAEDQMKVAEVIDRMTWARRWRQVCERIERRLAHEPLPSDEEIDEAVRSVRREKPLSARSSTHPS